MSVVTVSKNIVLLSFKPHTWKSGPDVGALWLLDADISCDDFCWYVALLKCFSFTVRYYQARLFTTHNSLSYESQCMYVACCRIIPVTAHAAFDKVWHHESSHCMESVSQFSSTVMWYRLNGGTNWWHPNAVIPSKAWQHNTQSPMISRAPVHSLCGWHNCWKHTMWLSSFVSSFMCHHFCHAHTTFVWVQGHVCCE